MCHCCRISVQRWLPNYSFYWKLWKSLVWADWTICGFESCRWPWRRLRRGSIMFLSKVSQAQVASLFLHKQKTPSSSSSSCTFLPLDLAVSDSIVFIFFFGNFLKMPTWHSQPTRALKLCLCILDKCAPLHSARFPLKRGSQTSDQWRLFRPNPRLNVSCLLIYTCI